MYIKERGESIVRKRINNGTSADESGDYRSIAYGARPGQNMTPRALQIAEITERRVSGVKADEFRPCRLLKNNFRSLSQRRQAAKEESSMFNPTLLSLRLGEKLDRTIRTTC
jgi:hypothetical protein